MRPTKEAPDDRGARRTKSYVREQFGKLCRAARQTRPAHFKATLGTSALSPGLVGQRANSAPQIWGRRARVKARSVLISLHR
jgi:hypothetical protein